MAFLHREFESQDFSLFTRLMYSRITVSFAFPFSDTHASYFALATKSNGLEGGSVFTSPIVACLYREYNCNNDSLLGRELRFLLSSAACSNSCANCVATILADFGENKGFYQYLLSG